MGKNIFETLVGAVVLAVAVSFIFIAYSGGRVKNVDGYMLTAKFDRVDGLNIGSDVRVSGLKVGKVLDQTINPKTFQAVITFAVAEEIKLPKDSSAEIIGDGLLGSKYLALVPGGSQAIFKDGDEIAHTQSAISIESLIAKVMFGASDSNEGKGADGDAKDEDDIF
jgi:phospholipid/cholesterol/gamma-HCH transport system substrate-binding protein